MSPLISTKIIIIKNKKKPLQLMSIGILREYEYFLIFVEHQLVRKVGDEFVRNERR